ncbi:MAG: hypothetical protein AABZ47_00345 [Planctomycetota bacterium]
MKKTEAQHSTCGSCGAAVYAEHINSGIARYEGDKLLCSYCVAEYEKSHDASSAPAASGDLDPILLHGDEEVAPEPAKSRIHAMSTTTLGAGHGWSDARFKRPLDPAGSGATRCRCFHSKLNESSLDFMSNLINDWLETNPQIVIKFATSTIGVFEGKHAEPNLIVTLFY